ncbi:DHA2 family efflux MFS transporter permease subunit [Actinophytocola sediminis]
MAGKQLSEPLDRKVLAVAMIVALGAVTPIIDMTIISVALHTLADVFDSDLATIQWVTTVYLLASAMVVPLTGWATAWFGARRLWLGALALFTFGSLLCGLAWSPASLILFRVIQGVGAGMLGPVGTAMVARVAGPKRMGRAMSLVGVPLVLGPVLGPVIGGIVLDLVSWRWIFLINLPIGLIAILLSARIFDRDQPTERDRIDARGFFLLCPGVTLSVYGLVNVSSMAALTSASFLLPSAAGVVLLALFVRHARRVDKPLLDIRLFANGTFASAAGVLFLANAILSGAMMVLPLYYQLARGETPLNAGLLLVPQGLGVAMMMPIAGRIVDRGKPGMIVLCGIPLIVAGFVSFTQAGDDGNYLRLGLSLWIIGVGTGCTMMPAMTATYRRLDPARIPHATATFSVIGDFGASSAVALFVVVLDAQLARNPDAVHLAFGNVFWLPLVLAIASAVPALLLAWRSGIPEPEVRRADAVDGVRGTADL